MKTPIFDFIHYLRQAGFSITPEASIDVLRAVQFLDYDNKAVIHDALQVILVKRTQDIALFNTVFEQFFNWEKIKKNDGINSISFDGAQFSEPSLILLSQDEAQLQLLQAQALHNADIEKITVFTQVGPITRTALSAIQAQGIDQDIKSLKDKGQVELAEQLQQYKNQFLEQLRARIWQQADIILQSTQQVFVDRVLMVKSLSNIEPREQERMQKLIKKIADKLLKTQQRKKKKARRGLLHMHRTLRHNMAYDATLFNLYFKKSKKKQAKLFVICDVSGSTRVYAQFLLSLLYYLDETIPKVRSFVFSSDLGEVTDDLKGLDMSSNIEQILKQWGMGSTNYTHSLMQFLEQTQDEINRQSSIIILGDARNNNNPFDLNIMKSLYKKVNYICWLNPEEKSRWGLGDSIMPQTSLYCHQSFECQTLSQLEKITAQLLKRIY